MPYPKRSLVDRFWSKVQKTDTCWLWTGGKDSCGYGAIKDSDKKQMSAHRLSWEIHNGCTPAGLVLHTCDNPACVNPLHLYVGTHEQNMRDKVLRDRTARNRGMRAGRACHLTETLVRAIRTRYVRGGISQAALGREFGVAQSTVMRIVHRSAWKETV
jgi:hypothetical protein